MNEKLIKQLQEGTIAVKNDGTLEDLKKVLKYACPKDNWPISGTYSFYIVYNIEWKGVSQTKLPSYSVKEFLKEEFVLPEKWCIKITEENHEILRHYFKNAFTFKNLYAISVIDFNYFNAHSSMFIDLKTYKWSDGLGILPEITFEQFKKYVLKEETMEKKIIGYKLIKPEYKDAAEKIVGINNWEVFEKKLNTVSWGYDARNSLQKAGVLDLWFGKVYEEEFKVGDWVIGWHTRNFNYHTTAWQINKINDEFIYPVENRCENTTSKSIRKATPEEIEEASTIKIGSYKVEFLNKEYCSINSVEYNKTHLETLKYLMGKKQIQSLNVGCSGQYKVDLPLLEKILAKF